MDGVKSRRTGLRAQRAEATRQRISEAARLLFRRDGYAATTLQAIADEAGVAVQTVYAVYGSKAGILGALREMAVFQPEAGRLASEAMGEASPDARLRLIARSIRVRWDAAADVTAIHRDAALVDRRLREPVEAVHARRMDGLTALAKTLDGTLRSGLDADRAAAILDALTMPEVYLELVEVQGWTSEEYEAWLGTALVEQLLAR
jgi:AcrR family transcriptional regulator